VDDGASDAAVSEAVVYLESDDEITTVVRRVRMSDADRVIVVVPGRSRATSSAVALRLLARAGEESGRSVAVVGDALTRSLAAEAGLAAWATLADARRAEPPIDEPTEVRRAAIHVVRGADETMATPAVQADEVTMPVTVSRAPSARTRRRGPFVIASIAVVAVLLMAGLAGAAMLPSATVTIQPAAEDIGPVEYAIEAADAERLTGTVEAAATVTATGRYDIVEPSVGTVLLFNFSSTDQLIAAGTLVAAGDQAYATAADVVVPRGRIIPDGRIQAGDVEVGVVAAEPGPAGNVAERAIDTVLSSGADARLQGYPENGQPRVTNPEPTSGGADEAGVRITRADVRAAVEALTADLRGQAANRVAEREDVILVQSELAEPTIEGADGLAGTRDRPEATIEGSLEWEAWEADRGAVIDEAGARLIDDANVVSDGHAVLPDSIEVTVEGADVEDGVLRIDVRASGRSVAQVDPESVAGRIAGLGAVEAQAALDDLGSATVELWPDWVESVPTTPWRIEVRVVEP
jgi:hypothetical protein